MVDDLVRERFSDVYRRLIDDIFERAGSPEAVSVELKKMGYLAPDGKAYSPRTMRSWRNRDHKPDPEQVMALACRYDISIDQLLHGQALRTQLTDQIADHARRLAEVEARLHGWEIEWAAAAGQEPPGSYGGGPISLAERAFERRVKALEQEVEELRRQQQA